MIRCPVCKHEELDGTLYCSDCGNQLWVGEARPVAAPGDAQDTQQFGADELSRTPPGEPADTSPVGGAAGARKILLRVQGIDRPIHLNGREEYRLGRGDPRHGVMPDLDLGPYRALELGVSRVHAVIRDSGPSVTLTDLGSTNGTTINGVRVMPNTVQPLRDGDELRLGKLSLQVFFTSG